MSRYHQLPRESMDSDRDDADHQYLIPSPHNGSVEDLYTSNTPPRTKEGGVHVNAKTLHRFVSIAFSLTAFLLMVLQGGTYMIPAAVFVMITLAFNVYMLIYSLTSRYVAFSLFYNERDLLVFGDGTFKKPNLSSYLDLLAAVGIFIPLTIALVDSRHGYYWHDPVASAVFGYLVIATQIIISIPTLGGLRLSVRRINTRISLKTKEERSWTKADKKITMMVGAIDVDAEETAIPAPLETVEPTVEPTAEVAVDLV